MKCVVFYSWCDPCGRSTSHVTRNGRAHCMEHPGMIAFMLAPKPEREERRVGDGVTVYVDGRGAIPIVRELARHPVRW